MSKIDIESRLTDVREEMLARWDRGERVRVECYLDRDQQLAADTDLVLDLIYSEVLLREEFGERPAVEEYVQRFPQHEEVLRRQLALHEMLNAASDEDTSWETTHWNVERSSMGTLGERNSDATGSDNHPHEIGAYEVLGEIGRGGMGIVYRARHRRLGNRLAAVKVLRLGQGAASEEVARFRREAQAVASLQHEHIVPIYDYGSYRPIGTAEEVPYIAFEYAAGGSLAQKINGTPLPPRQAAELLLPLAQALEQAHHQGIVHRDLKPANILLTKEGKPRITDFGLARQLDADTCQTKTGAIMGTPSYMPPEQAAGRTAEIGAAADIYALGATFYEMLTGRPPFKGDTVLHTLQQVTTLEPVPPTRLQPTLPRDLETICLKCLQKDPVRRYASAGELAADLQRFLAGEPIRARPVSLVERGLKWVHRRPAAAALLAVSTVGLGLLVGLWVSFTFQLQKEKQLAEEGQREAKKQATDAQLQRQQAEKERNEARRQAERANSILGYTLSAVDSIAMNVRSAKTEELNSGNSGLILFRLACSYGKTSTALASDRDLPLRDRQRLSEQYAATAVKLLECARQVGFFERSKVENRQELQRHPDLNGLRKLPAFTQFLARLSGG